MVFCRWETQQGKKSLKESAAGRLLDAPDSTLSTQPRCFVQTHERSRQIQLVYLVLQGLTRRDHAHLRISKQPICNAVGELGVVDDAPDGVSLRVPRVAFRGMETAACSEIDWEAGDVDIIDEGTREVKVLCARLNRGRDEGQSSTNEGEWGC